jgi:hypothetical protein
MLIWMIGAATLAGGVVGLVAGVVARLAMRVLFELNPSTEGLLVGGMFPVGSFSFQGTFVILFQAVIVGALAGAVYGLCRPALPRSPALAGLLFGVWIAATFIGLLVVGEDRDSQLFGPFLVAVGLFVAIFVLFGVAVGVTAERSSLLTWQPAGTVRRWITFAGLVGTAIAGIIVKAQELSTRT